jgi:hypothetical protein
MLATISLYFIASALVMVVFAVTAQLQAINHWLCRVSWRTSNATTPRFRSGSVALNVAPLQFLVLATLAEFNFPLSFIFVLATVTVASIAAVFSGGLFFQTAELSRWFEAITLTILAAGAATVAYAGIFGG